MHSVLIGDCAMGWAFELDACSCTNAEKEHSSVATVCFGTSGRGLDTIVMFSIVRLCAYDVCCYCVSIHLYTSSCFVYSHTFIFGNNALTNDFMPPTLSSI